MLLASSHSYELINNQEISLINKKKDLNEYAAVSYSNVLKPEILEIHKRYLVAEFLHHNGVENVFGVVSVHNIPMLDAIGRRNFIRMIPARGEMGAGHMADGYARAKNGLGVVFTSTGPGAANAAGSIVEARFAGSPVLHFTGQTATSNLDKNQGTVHDVYDQLGMLKSISKKAIRINNAEEALEKLIDAVKIALTPPMGPVSIEIPIDVQRTNIERPVSIRSN